MEQERLMVSRAAEGRIFMGGFFNSKDPVVPVAQPMAVTQAAAATTATGGKQKTKDFDRRKRMALAGQQSTSAGGSMGSTGGASYGQTLMGG